MLGNMSLNSLNRVLCAIVETSAEICLTVRWISRLRISNLESKVVNTKNCIPEDVPSEFRDGMRFILSSIYINIAFFLQAAYA